MRKRFTKKKSRKKDSNFGLPLVVGGSTSHRIVSTLKSFHFGHPAGRNAMVKLQWKKMLKRTQQLTASAKPVHRFHCT
jgi:hypothetical protein